MNLELFIAKRILNYKEIKDSISGPITKIAVFSIALSITIIICTIFIVTGFKNEVSNKVTGFGGHIQISKLTSNISFETPPISSNHDFYPNIDTIKGIHNIQVYASKPGIVKTSDIIQGIVIKGISSDFNWSFFKENLVEGNIFNIEDSVQSNKVVISKSLSDLINLGVGDKFNVFFIQNPPRARRFEICGIYQTTLDEFDKLYVLADIKHIQALNGWSDDQISGFEIILDDFKDLDKISEKVKNIAGYRILDDGSILNVSTVKEKNVQLFDWLGLFDLNVLVIIIIMLIVAGINMISGLLILVLEKTQMIGILKSLGTNNRSIMRTFIYLASFITVKGLFWGNIAGLLICFIQYKFQVLKLDPSAYFLNAVPINFNLLYWILINLGAFGAILLALLNPASIILKITPAETIRYE